MNNIVTLFHNPRHFDLSYYVVLCFRIIEPKTKRIYLNYLCVMPYTALLCYCRTKNNIVPCATGQHILYLLSNVKSVRLVGCSSPLLYLNNKPVLL